MKNIRLRNFQILFLLFINFYGTQQQFPLVLNTWRFTQATARAWEVLNDEKYSGLDALVEGCSLCERQQCDGTVGYGGSPDENGETTLDAMVMQGSDFNTGCVAGLRQVKDAIAVARHVLEHTQHTLLVGDQATEFAVMMGFKRESLSTAKSKDMWKTWKSSNCQPNFWINVLPNPQNHCGPYSPVKEMSCSSSNQIDYKFNEFTNSHDTIGMIVIDRSGKMFAGTSTNGVKHKIPGRVGDSPIPGSGAYANNEIGAAAATGDGDILMRFLPSFTAVENLRNGLTPKQAAEDAIKRIKKYYKQFMGGVIVVNRNGEHSAACSGMKKFPYSVRETHGNGVVIHEVDCINN